MPFFVMLLLLVAAIPTRAPLPSAEQQIERQREELKALNEKHGDDAQERLREQMSVL